MGASNDMGEAGREPGYERSVLEAVIETVPNGILVVDENREFFTYNNQFIEMWDIPEEVVVSGDDQQALDAVLDSLVDPSAFLETVEYFYDHPHGESQDELELTDGRVFERYTGPARDDEDGYYGRVWVFEDVTERVRARREFEQKNERLEAFIDILTHDLQSPLNVAAGRTELAREETGNEHLAAVVRSHERMQTMLDELLTLACGEKDPNKAEAVSLADLAHRSWETVPTADATLRVDTERTFRADPRLLRELLENLLGNAVEHGSTGSRTQSDDAARHGGENVTVTVGDFPGGFYVADDGPGIPESERERVFETRYTTDDDGTGLGLRIVSQVANAHGWNVEITESDEGGARFEVTGVDEE